MNKYRLKSVVVEAEQVKKRKSVTVSGSKANARRLNYMPNFPTIAEKGDWLVYQEGLDYPTLCTEEEFDSIYEPA